VSTTRLARDRYTGRAVMVAPARAGRPVGTAEDCPFCPGGREAPTPFTAPYAFANRWPPLTANRCDIVVHGAGHDDFGTMPASAIRRVVDLWAERSEQLAAKSGVRSVVVFENRGAASGASVVHPHSQIFGLPLVPEPLREAIRACSGSCPLCRAPRTGLLVARYDGWRVEVPSAPLSPYAVRLVPNGHDSRLAELNAVARDGLASSLAGAVSTMDRLLDRPMPYQLWITQAHQPHRAHLCVDVVGLLRAPDHLRILGAAELATGMFFTSLDPLDAAKALRQATSSAKRRLGTAGGPCRP
jgi:UDPglucose--hexose-1-phosphate uridylyltransferase